MAFGGYGGGNNGARRTKRPFTRQERTTIIVVAAVALIAILLRTHRIDRYDVMYFCLLVPSIILHEVSHGWAALAFGDDTAKRAGRLNLNPIRHVDPVGTLLVPALLSLTGLGAYGWAKPVPVSTFRLRHPRNEAVLVALAGPLTNIVLIALCGVGFALTTPEYIRVGLHQNLAHGYLAYPPSFWSQVFLIGGLANIVLGVFNLIPCPPLDGAAVLERFIPTHALPSYYRLQPLLMFLPFILILLFRNQFSELMYHVLTWWSGLLT